MRKERIARAILLTLARIALMVTFASCCSVAQGQEPTTPSQQRGNVPSPILEETQKNPSAPCVQPPPLVRWQDYQGPFAKVVGAFGRKVERKSVHPVHYKSGVLLC